MILVVSGSGLMALNFIRRWIRLHPDDTVLNLARNPCSDPEVATSPQLVYIPSDIMDVDRAVPDNVDLDVIVHCAAQSSVDKALRDPVSTTRTNVLGTQAVLEFARRRRTKLHLVSTLEVFGIGQDGQIDENTALKPQNPYGASAAAAAMIANSYYSAFGVNLTVTFGANTFGPYQRPDKLIARVITRALDGDEIPIYGNGAYRRNWLYVEDHCAAIETVLLRGTAGHSYCVAGARDVAPIDIARYILDYLDRPYTLLRAVNDRPAQFSHPNINTDRIRQLGWHPAYEFEVALRRTIQWYIDNRNLWSSVD